MPPIERPTVQRLIEILRMNDEAGDILCGHAADEIERLWELVNGMSAAIETAGFVYRNTDSGPNLVR